MTKEQFLLLITSILAVASCQDPTEKKAPVQIFQSCFDASKKECFKECEQTPLSTWDQWSTRILGYKIINKKPYNRCQDRCINIAHVDCTEEIQAQGIDKVFMMYGKWPLKRIGFIEEVSAALFCFLGTLTESYMLYKYYRAIPNEKRRPSPYGFEGLAITYHILWTICYFSAFIFHTTDTYLTERLDYYTAFIAMMFTNYITYIRVFWVRDRQTRTLLLIPTILYAAYHIYYMQFVSFDYGYNAKVVAILGITNTILWLSWAYRHRKEYPQVKMLVAAQASIWTATIFEVFDFPPLFGYVDAHSLWHLFGLLVAATSTQFFIDDMKYYWKGITKLD